MAARPCSLVTTTLSVALRNMSVEVLRASEYNGCWRGSWLRLVETEREAKTKMAALRTRTKKKPPVSVCVVELFEKILSTPHNTKQTVISLGDGKLSALVTNCHHVPLHIWFWYTNREAIQKPVYFLG